MSRIRDDFKSGTTNANLTAAATSITFSAAPTFDTLSGNDYIPIVLGTTKANPEIAYITAYSSGSTTATISRGEEGTAGSTHASGVTWLHGPTVLDWAGARKYLDPLGPAVDSEAIFEVDSTGLTHGDFTFAWRNQGSATFESKYGTGSLFIPGQASNNIRILEVTDTSTSWQYEMSFDLITEATNFWEAGMFMFDSGTGEAYAFWVEQNNTINVYQINSVTSFGSLQGSAFGMHGGLLGHSLHLRVTKNTATDFDFELSPDGIHWWSRLSGHNPSGFLTIDRVGFGGSMTHSDPIIMSVHSFRKIS